MFFFSSIFRSIEIILWPYKHSFWSDLEKMVEQRKISQTTPGIILRKIFVYLIFILWIDLLFKRCWKGFVITYFIYVPYLFTWMNKSFVVLCWEVCSWFILGKKMCKEGLVSWNCETLTQKIKICSPNYWTDADIFVVAVYLADVMFCFLPCLLAVSSSALQGPFRQPWLPARPMKMYSNHQGCHCSSLEAT